MVRATMKVPEVGTRMLDRPLPIWKMMQVVCRVMSAMSPMGSRMGREVAACPLAEGIRRLRKFWNTYIPSTVREEGSEVSRPEAPYRMVWRMLPPSSTMRMPRAKPTASAPAAKSATPRLSGGRGTGQKAR